MNTIHMLLTGICLVLVSCNQKDTQSQSTSETTTATAKSITYKDISIDELQSAFGKEDYILIDVRTPEEIANGMIEGAKHIDYVSTDFKDQINLLDKNQNYVVYCRSGGRSTKTSQLMQKLGFKNVANLEGGYLAFTDSQ